ncbi:hypothetical protein CLF_111200, partial [Clonorchis sinensis]
KRQRSIRPRNFQLCKPSTKRLQMNISVCAQKRLHIRRKSKIDRTCALSFCLKNTIKVLVQYNACQMHVSDGSKSRHASGDSASLNLEDEQSRSDLRPSHQGAKYDKNSEKLVAQLGTEGVSPRIKTQKWRHSSENSALEENHKSSAKSCNTYSDHCNADKSSGFKKNRIGKVAAIVKFLEELIKQPDTMNLDSYCKKDANSPVIYEHPNIRRQVYAACTCTEKKHDQNGTRTIDKCLPVSADAFEIASVSREKRCTSTPRPVKNFEYSSKGVPNSPQMDLPQLARRKVHQSNAMAAGSSGTLESLVSLRRRSIFKATPLSEIQCSATLNESLHLNTQGKISRDQISVEKDASQTHQPDTNNLHNLKRLEMVEQEQSEIVNRLLRNTEAMQGKSTADRSRKSVKINGTSNTLINRTTVMALKITVDSLRPLECTNFQETSYRTCYSPQPSGPENCCSEFYALTDLRDLLSGCIYTLKTMGGVFVRLVLAAFALVGLLTTLAWIAENQPSVTENTMEKEMDLPVFSWLTRPDNTMSIEKLVARRRNKSRLNLETFSENHCYNIRSEKLVLFRGGLRPYFGMQSKRRPITLCSTYPLGRSRRVYKRILAFRFDQIVRTYSRTRKFSRESGAVVNLPRNDTRTGCFKHQKRSSANQLDKVRKSRLMFHLVRYSRYRSTFSQRKILTRMAYDRFRPTGAHQINSGDVRECTTDKRRHLTGVAVTHTAPRVLRGKPSILEAEVLCVILYEQFRGRWDHCLLVYGFHADKTILESLRRG